MVRVYVCLRRVTFCVDRKSPKNHKREKGFRFPFFLLKPSSFKRPKERAAALSFGNFFRGIGAIIKLRSRRWYRRSEVATGVLPAAVYFAPCGAGTEWASPFPTAEGAATQGRPYKERGRTELALAPPSYRRKTRRGQVTPPYGEMREVSVGYVGDGLWTSRR